MKKKLISLFSILLISSLTLVGCNENNQSQKELESITLMLDWVPNTNHTGIYVAKTKGWYEEVGLDVEIVQPPEGGTAQLVGSGQAEFGVSYQEEVTYARANDIPVVSVGAIIQHNTSGFASPIDKNITSPKDFEGKRYGGWGSPSENAMIKSIMEKDDGDVNKVEFVNVGAADFFTVTKKDVDFAWIYYGWTGIEAELREYPINYISLKDFAPELDFYTPVIITTEEYISENPDTIKKFMEATTKGYEFAINNPDAAAEIFLDQVPGMDEELVFHSQQWLSNKYQDDAEQWGVQEATIWENYAKWMNDYGLIPKMIDTDKAFTNEFLPNR